MSDNPFADLPALSEAELEEIGSRIADLPFEQAEWVAALLLECRRARAVAEAGGGADVASVKEDLTQIVLDAAEWLRTLWEVGYMGASTLPAPPRTQFPQIEVEDVLKSTLFARIRQGHRPLPFPPPTRDGNPWHEIVGSDACHAVSAEIIEDEGAPAFAIIEGCNRWIVHGTEQLADCANDYLVQHDNKGPIYRLRLTSDGATLQREAPTEERRIVARERAGIRSYMLAWQRDDGSIQEVPLRAATREGAEAAAGAWIAAKHPQHYGRVRFTHD